MRPKDSLVNIPFVTVVYGCLYLGRGAYNLFHFFDRFAIEFRVEQTNVHVNKERRHEMIA